MRNGQNQMMLRVLINRYHPYSVKEFIACFPQEEKQGLLLEKIQSNDPSPLLQTEQVLRKIHPSWFKPLIETFPPLIQELLLSSTDKKPFSFFSSILRLSPPVQSFLFQQFFHLLKLNEHLPLEYLPSNECSVLMNWKKEKQLQLIDFLGLPDLAFEVRYLVNRQYLNNIYSCLTSKEMAYLKICLRQKEKISTPRLKIDPTKQDCLQLRKILHRRGLIRLGKTLSGEHPDFVWHFVHRFDKNRGEFLLKEASLAHPAQMIAFLKQQMIHLMHFLGEE